MSNTEHASIAAGRLRWSADDPTPKFGWKRFDVVDRGAQVSTCEMCGARIRREHHMRHPSSEQRLVAGRVCSGYMALTAHHTLVPPEDIERAVADAAAMDKAPTKLLRMEEKMNADAAELRSWMSDLSGHSLSTLSDHLLRFTLARLLRRAVQREKEVDALLPIHGWLHFEHRKAIEDAIVEVTEHISSARDREDQDRLIEATLHPQWRATRQGWRARGPLGDVMQVYLRSDGMTYGGMFMLAGHEEKWSPTSYDDPQIAKERVSHALLRGLIRVGRLPEKRPPRPIRAHPPHQ